VVIIGGGIIGSSAAYFLAKSGNGISVAVVEADSTYERATTPQGAGGVRQQFSVAENISQSIYSLDFYKHWNQHLNGIDNLPDLNFSEQGYLFVAGKNGVSALKKNVALQSAMGVKTELLCRAALRKKFPSVSRDDIEFAVYTPDDGWIDPTAALAGFRRGAIQHGTKYIDATVNGIEHTATKATGVTTTDGRSITADYVINCAGPWAGEVAQMTKASLPVVPMCRVQHFWKSALQIEALPLVKDEAGLFFRPEGDGYVGGIPGFDIPPGFVENIHSGFFANYFEEAVWPQLASLVTGFDEIRLQRSWAGHYAQNQLDGNLIIGRYSSRHHNLLTACGFSGHGIMHAPAVGLSLAELVLNGSFQTLDLNRFGFDRVRNNQPLAETGIK